MKCWLEACHSSVWSGRNLATSWACKAQLSPLVSVDQWHQASSTIDMETLEQLGVSVGIKTNRTVQLLVKFLEYLFGHYI